MPRGLRYTQTGGKEAATCTPAYQSGKQTGATQQEIEKLPGGEENAAKGQIYPIIKHQLLIVNLL